MDIAAEFVKSWTKLTKEWNARLESELAPTLTAGQLEVLELLQAYEPMKPSELLPHLETTPAAITTLLDRMERGGLVERNRDESDRRIVWVTMTELGKAEVLRGVQVRSDVVGRSLSRLSSHNRQLLGYLIGKVAGTRESRDAAAAARSAAGTGDESAERPAGEPAEASLEPPAKDAAAARLVTGAVPSRADSSSAGSVGEVPKSSAV